MNPQDPNNPDQNPTPQNDIPAAVPASTPIPDPSTAQPTTPPVVPAAPIQPQALPDLPISAPPTGRSGLHKTLIVMSGFLVLLILMAGLLAATSSPKKSSTKDTKATKSSSAASSSSTTDAKKADPAKAVVAESLSDFSNLCKGGTVSNAAAYTGAAPHRIVVFDPSIVNKGSYLESAGTYKLSQDQLADYKAPATTQLVGCMDIASKSKSTQNCTLKDSSGKEVKLPFIPVTYKLTVYEAKTGKVVTTGTIPGPATTCPYIASYTDSDPNLYGTPDPGSLKEAVNKYVTST